MAEVDIRSIPRNELGILGGAIVAFLGLFFRAYSVKASAAGFHESFGLSGWHFFNLWFPVLLLVAAAGLVAVRRFRADLVPALPVGTRVIVAGVAVLALVWTVLRGLTYPSASASFTGGHYSAGAGFGTYLVCLAVAVAAAFAVIDLRESGEKIPSIPKAPPTGDAA